MVKKLLLFGFVFIFALMTISSISAEIIISQTSQVYSLGDELNVNVDVGALKPGYLDLSMTCNSQNINLYLNVPEASVTTIKRKLTPLYVGNLLGTCYLNANYGLETKQSPNFEISNAVKIDLVLQDLNVIAGESLVIRGKAVMADGNNLGANQNAFVEVSLNNIPSSSSIQNGEFAVNLTVPTTLRKGDYNLNVRAYDIDSDNKVLNNGATVTNVKVNQIPSSPEIALDKTSIKPGENVSIIPFLYDLAGELYNQEMLMQITDSRDNIVFKGVVSANQEFVLITNTTYAPGETSIILQKNNLTVEKSIDVEELKLLDVKILNGTMTITNIGNVPYSGIIQVDIDNIKILKEIDLQVGASKEYLVSAPNGEHEVSLKDDETQFFSQGVPLSGNAISVNEKISNIFMNYPVVWIFIILVILGSGYAMYRKKKYGKVFFLPHSQRTPYKGMEFKIKNRKNENIGIIEIAKPKIMNVGTMMSEKKQDNEKINIRGEIRNAEPSSDIQGQKQPVCVIALKIKNPLIGIANDNVKKALEYAYHKKAVTYSSGSSIIAIISPLLTKTFKNEEIGIKIAQDMEMVLKEHNRRFKDKILFGIGVNSGDLINKLENNVLRFTSIDKTIPLAKKIAELSDGEVLLSSGIHTKTMNSVKAEKNTHSGNIDTFRIKRIVDNEEARKFIEKFTRRN